MRLVLVLLSVVGLASAQESVREDPPTVVVLGASVSAGFEIDRGVGVDRTITMARACRGIWPDGVARVVDCADGMTFMNPEKSADVRVGQALRARPDLVVGVDFLFWFGYGKVRGGSDEAQARERFRMQETGLEFLDEFECPIIVGDYPDMQGADPRFLPPWAVPEPEVLDQLNQRLQAWARARPRVAVMPLADWVARAKRSGERVTVRGSEVELAPELLLQSDRLHATRLGVALLAHRLLPVARRVLDSEHRLLVDPPRFELVARRLEVEYALPAEPMESEHEAARSGRAPREE